MNETVMTAPETASPRPAPMQEPPAPAPMPIPERPMPPVMYPAPAPRRSGVAVASLLVSILSLLILAAILGLMLIDRDIPALFAKDEEPVVAEPAEPPVEEPEEAEVPVVVFREQEIPMEQVPLNEYNPAAFITRDSGQITYEANGLEAVPGIDVSEFQGDINWKQVKDSGMEFAIIRVGLRGYGTAGNIVMDKNFEKNITGALDAGLKVGVYFFSQAINMDEAREEAQFVLDAIAGYPISYPVVFDWERITNGQNARTDGLSGKAVTMCASAFCEVVEDAGYQPAVYFNQTLGYLSLELEQLVDYPFWLAAYTSKPNFYYHFDMWQYSATGLLPGIQGHVDLNLSFRDFAAE